MHPSFLLVDTIAQGAPGHKHSCIFVTCATPMLLLVLLLLQVAIIEQGVAPGGGAWLGGQLFSAMCVSG